MSFSIEELHKKMFKELEDSSFRQGGDGMPSYHRVLGAYLDAEREQGAGHALDCKEFRCYIGESLWDPSLPSKCDNAQKALFEWWMECKGRLEEFQQPPPQNFIESI